MSTPTQIRVERHDDVVVLRLDRPAVLNAWTPTMAEELAAAIVAGDADPSVGAYVVTGSGRGFCAGADTAAVFQSRIDGVDPGADTAGGLGGMPRGLDWVALLRGAKPIVAAVNGVAVGIGVTQILPCDRIIAAESARFGSGFVKMALVPELASSHFLVQRMGFGAASHFFLSGQLVGAGEALRLGLVDEVVPDEALLETALATARLYAANPPGAMRMIKDLLTRNGTETDLAVVQQREQALLAQCWATAEHAEAVAAFRDKRPAVFRPPIGAR
jgi:enoyl-CoA hydratase/carnithine racemase